MIPEETAAGRQPHNLRRELYRTNDFADIEVYTTIAVCHRAICTQILWWEIKKKKYMRGNERFSCYCGCEFYAFRCCDFSTQRAAQILYFNIP